MQRILDGLARLSRLIQKAGPYLILELLLPGGTAFALLLFLYRSGKFHCGGMGLLVPVRVQVLSCVAWPSLSEVRIRESIHRNRIAI